MTATDTEKVPALAPPATRQDEAPTFDRADGSGNFHYLAFVDGLRAISILAVVAYHVGVPGVPGGFIGVDIFFVISGFLIINQIKSGLSSDRFSILSFYAQRGLRILPPYLIVLLVTYAVAPIFLPTTAIFWDFLASAALAPLMVTNIAFYLGQGYFDISGIDKPLLHTWTLSVEEQFYFVAPIILLLIFHLGKRRFGLKAVLIGLALGAASLAGAIAETTTTGKNAAFYLPYWRAWEFVAGGLIGGQLVAAVGRWRRGVVEALAWLGIGFIVLATSTFSGSMPYPSSNAVLPVAGAALVILCGSARPEITVTRLLSLRWMVAIGLVSYSWYLWHWPLISFVRIVRLNETSLVIDGLCGGLLAFLLACVSYRYIEQPIRRWRKSPGRLKNPDRIVLRLVAASLATSLLGATTALGGHWSTKSFLASHYGVDGKGVLDNGCEGKSGLPESCFAGPVGVLVGDSHATVLFGTFAKRFDALGMRLISAARGSCSPLMLAPSQRDHARRDDCARLIAPFERLISRPDPVSFAIISGFWGYSNDAASLVSGLISEFDPLHTRVLLIGPVPIFPQSSLECVVLSDRYQSSRDRCVAPRREFETSNSAIVNVLKSMTVEFPNVRYIDPIDVFCDQSTCRPFKDDEVLYVDTHHLSPAGADRLFDSFKDVFIWLAHKE